MTKTRTLTLEYGGLLNAHTGAEEYKVKSVTDSVEFVPGQRLAKKDVEALCESKEWKITIVAKQWK